MRQAAPIALALAALLAAASPTWAADLAAAPPGYAAGVDLFAASDADHTDVTKLGLTFDWRYAGPERHEGLRLEVASYRPLGQATTDDLRVYYRFADKARGWTWNGQAGTDGKTVLGAFDIHDDRFRQEYFLEREIVETPQGLKHGVYYTFAGGAFDAPLGPRDTLNLVGAVQDFTGDNARLHARVNYVHVLQPDWGLSVQLRARAFNSSAPGEFDYFSPRWYVQVTPVLQLRRFSGGWRYLLSGGVGAQMQTGQGWRQARVINAQVTSPPTRAGWAFDAAFAYSNTPVAAGYVYDYRQLTLGVTRAF